MACIKKILKKQVAILITLLMILFVVIFCRRKDGMIFVDDINISSAFERIIDLEKIKDEVNERGSVMKEYLEMKRQENVVELDIHDATYIGPERTTADRVSAFVKNSEGSIYKYNIYKQNSSYEAYETFMAYHGCSVCALTTLLNATVPKLADYTPDRVISEIQKSTFGEDVFTKNYSRIMRLQMPVTMYGITRILDKYNVKHSFTYEYTNEQAVSEITEHLKEGNPVIITLRKKKGNKKWAGSVHTLLLIGLDDEGNALVCDSANRSWAGKNQRVKFGKVEELVDFMWSSKELSTSVYYSGRKGTSGYILVN